MDASSLLETARFLLYAVGFAFSLTIALQLFRLRQPLSRMLAAFSLAWTANCAILALLLVEVRMLGASPSWGGVILTANAVLLAAAPVALYVWFARQNGR